MAWLAHDGRVLATLEVPGDRRGRRRGLLGRGGIDGAMLLRRVRSVHTVGMTFPIDAAQCDADLRVLRVVTLPPNRVLRPVRGVQSVVEAEAGAFARWSVGVGDVLEVLGE